MEKYKKFLVFISVLAIVYSSKAQVHIQDSLALIALYNSTDGANWDTRWDLSQPVDTWHGVDVSGGRVTKLFLHGNDLSGSIPRELDNLTQLTRLVLDSNQLSGSIPVELGKLINLTELWLSRNQLNGSIPVELGKLTNLTELWLHNNQLSGSIPGELGKLNNLTGLWLYNNQFDELPDLSSLTSLQYFRVQNNRLDFGDILPNIGVLTDYSPQASIREGVRYTPSIGKELTLSVQVEGTNNIYQWFKNNIALSSATSDNLKLSNIQTADHGLYYCQITNFAAPYLTLRFIPDTVIVMQRMNNAPTDIALSFTIIEENKVIGTMIGILSTTDPDASDDHTYSLLGTDANSFQIIEDTLKSAAVFDYETKNSYTITIQTEDAGGLTYQKDFMISIDEFTALDEWDISNEVTIYPNPNNGIISLKIGKMFSGKVTLGIYSLEGKELINTLINHNKNNQRYNLNIEQLPRGTYILSLKSKKYYANKKLIKY